eukprot:evm.model.scf_3119EXC.1 EVM.evm.TU.scf_3119EXC.1   scf_3119EXC:983-9869(+)
MSLFKARDWWRTKCGSGEEFDQGCLCLANVDNNPSGKEKIVIGSFGGVLRVYLPAGKGYKVEDQLLEVDLKQPVLQLEAGHFSASGGIQLAILHPFQLCICSLASSGGKDSVNYMQLTQLYQHKFEHTVANMVHGPFGGISGADFICVQSYDGQLSFLEQESTAFTRHMPNFLIPGPLCYCSQTDSFITCNAALELVCYKYQMLAAANGAASKDTNGGIPSPGMSQTKTLQADWTLVLGEAVKEIRVGRISAELASEFQVDIIALGEHTLFCVSTLGEITMQKRLEYHPSACLPYPVREPLAHGGHENLLISTHTGAILVYSQSRLVWAAKADCTPVALRVGAFGGINGMVVMLDDEGNLTVGYMGTDPPTSVVAAEGKEPDYEGMEREHRELLAVIRGNSVGVQKGLQQSVVLQAQVPAILSSSQDPNDFAINAGALERSAVVVVHISYLLPGALEEVHLTVTPPKPITVLESSLIIPHLEGGDAEPAEVQLTFLPSDDCVPSSSTAMVVASYCSPQGEPEAASLQIPLPMGLFCHMVAPVKTSEHKVTVDTNRHPPHLLSLFEDMVAQSTCPMEQVTRVSAGNVLTFQYYNGDNCSVILSKLGGRYRIQADSLEAMWLVLQELGIRLDQYYALAEADSRPQEDGPFRMSLMGDLPLDDYFVVVDDHFNRRNTIRDLRQQLDQRAQQFRSVQKRLLVRFKDRNPTPPAHLDVLMAETYSELMDLGDKMETAQGKLHHAQAALAASTRLILHLIRCCHCFSCHTTHHRNWLEMPLC